MTTARPFAPASSTPSSSSVSSTAAAPTSSSARGSTVWPARGHSRAALVSALAVAAELGTGELVAEHVGGEARTSGRVFLHEGQIAWVVAGNDRRRLTDVLEAAGIDVVVLDEVFRRCQRDGSNLGEALVELGVVSHDAVRDALRKHNAQQLERLLTAPLSVVRFTPLRRSYASSLLFAVDELLDATNVDLGATRAEIDAASDDTTSPLVATSAMTTNMTDDALGVVPTGEESMSNIKASLDDVMGLDGAIAAALVDWESGLTLGVVGGGNGFDIELAASGNTSVVKAKMNVMKQLGISGGIEDILITLGGQYHLIRPLTSNTSLFIYVAIDKNRGNLGLARHKLRQIESGLTI